MTNNYYFITPTERCNSFYGEAGSSGYPLDRVSLMLAPVTVSSAMLFKGQIEIEAFKSALSTSINSFPYMTGAMYEEKKDGKCLGAYVLPRKVDDFTPKPEETNGTLEPACLFENGFMILEHDGFLGDSSGSKEYDLSLPASEYLPKKVNPKMLRFDPSVDGMPIAALKVTQYKSHFIFGIRFNHAFFDCSSVVQFFIFVSRLYSFPSISSPISYEAPLNPVFNPKTHIIPDNIQFVDDSDCLSACPKGYTMKELPPISFVLGSTLEMIFDSTKLNEFKNQGTAQVSEVDGAGMKTMISSNDILHAIALKALARYASSTSPSLNHHSKEEIRLYFARNMRKPLGFGDDVIGDYIRSECFPLLLSQALSSSVYELAVANRRSLSHQSHEPNEVRKAYSRECQFIQQCHHHSSTIIEKNNGFPFCEFFRDNYSLYVTNWNSFPFEKVQFKQRNNDAHKKEEGLQNNWSCPIEILTETVPYVAEGAGFLRVGFRNHSYNSTRYSVSDGEGKRKETLSNKQLIVVLTTRYLAIVKEFQELAKETGLFVYSTPS
jgi:hypothetical protein